MERKPNWLIENLERLLEALTELFQQREISAEEYQQKAKEAGETKSPNQPN